MVPGAYDVGDTVCSHDVLNLPKGTTLAYSGTDQGMSETPDLYFKIVELPDLEEQERQRIYREISDIVRDAASSGVAHDVITPVAKYVQENFTRNGE